MNRVYLDANATTPLDARVKEQMSVWLDCGNASSPHAEGRAARDAIDRAREQVAALIGAHEREIVFTSGATEANALALLGSMRATKANSTFCSAIEHPSVLRTLEAVRNAAKLTVGAVDGHGTLVELPDGHALVSVMYANNETGVVQNVPALAERVHGYGGILHCDAVQACGKLPVDVAALGVDLLTLSAHKMHGPKGVGALYAKRGTPMEPLFFGGEHERGMRAGTENVAAIVGLGAAAELASVELSERNALWTRLHAELVGSVRAQIDGAHFHLAPTQLPNTLSMRFDDAEGEAVLLGLDLEGVAVATGSACSSGAAEPSHVLRAIGLSEREVEQSIRVSFHAQNTSEDVTRAVAAMCKVVKGLRALSGSSNAL